jgi:Fur family transcriptional regulator, iron response regulator
MRVSVYSRPMDHVRQPPRADRKRLHAELLFAREQHLTADQVIQALGRDGAHVSKATVYNTLNLLAAKGLLKPLQVDPAGSLFDSNTEPHHHFHVEDTGELIDVPPGAVQFSRLPALPPGTESVAVEVIFRVRRKG